MEGFFQTMPASGSFIKLGVKRSWASAHPLGISPEKMISNSCRKHRAMGNPDGQRNPKTSSLGGARGAPSLNLRWKWSWS